MKRLSLIVFGCALSACGGAVHVEAQTPTLPTVNVEAQADVDAAPEVSAADPEEVTATTEPPDPVYEEQLDPIGPGYVWVGGSWGWTGSDWAWYPGRWLQPPEGRVYIEPYYERVGGRVVFVGGFWGDRNAPPRSYGGERLVFTAAVRPANYRRGEPVHVARSGGAPPGSRPSTFYAHATGTPRSVPTATVPSRTAARETHAQNAHEGADQGHADQGHADQGHTDQGHTDQGHTDQGHTDQSHTDQSHADQSHADQSHADHDHPTTHNAPTSGGAASHGKQPTPDTHKTPTKKKK